MKSKSIFQNPYIWLFLCSMFVFLFTDCHRRSPIEDNGNKKRTLTEKEHHGIDVTVEHIQHPSYDYNFCFKLDKQDESDLWIEPTSTYYDKYISDEPMEIPACRPFIHNEYPILGCYIVNNTDSPMSIDRLVLEVSKSEKDPLPFLYIFTDEEYRNSLKLYNEGWENWGKANLEYRILKRNEVFDGKYNKKKEIPYFEDDYQINLINDLLEMGYDVTAISKATGEEEESIKESGIWVEILDKNYDEWQTLCSPVEIGKYVPDDDSDDTDEEINYYGFARIYGQLTFAHHPLKVNFKGIIYLSSSGGGGAGDEIDDSFDVDLKPVGNDYVLQFPYVTSIAPGGNERINLRLKCSRSAIHHFKIKVVNSNDLDISSKNIHLHYIIPRDGEI